MRVNFLRVQIPWGLAYVRWFSEEIIDRLFVHVFGGTSDRRPPTSGSPLCQLFEVDQTSGMIAWGPQGIGIWPGAVLSHENRNPHHPDHVYKAACSANREHRISHSSDTFTPTKTTYLSAWSCLISKSTDVFRTVRPFA